MHDYDAENGQLKLKLSQLEADLTTKYGEVDTLRNMMEQSNIEHSNIMTEKDRQMESLQQRLDQDQQHDSHLELSELSDTSGGGLQTVISDLTTAANIINNCDTCDTNICDKLREAVGQLQCLTTVVYHPPPTTDMYRCISEDDILVVDHDTTAAATEEEETLLESQLSELTLKLDRMESEMCIVSEESCNLQLALELKEQTISDQVRLYDSTEYPRNNIFFYLI